jgi:hypothetical protein
LFGSVILDVAIGLILVYLLLSLIATAAREGIESMMKSRAVQLERGIRALLDDPSASGYAPRVYQHPLIASLYEGEYDVVARRRTGANLPAYIPTGLFVKALLDLALRPAVPAPYVAEQTDVKFTTDTLRASIDRIESPAVQRALRSAVDSAQGDIDRVRSALADWYDGTMDRVSGWYKHQTQWVLLAIGLAMAIIIDVDTLRIGQHLYKSPALRSVAVAMAERVAADTTFRARTVDSAAAGRALAQLDSLQLPILWKGVQPNRSDIGRHVLDSILGWVVSALAVSLGAPFWFDLLNKFMVIRSTVKPHEKSPEEASEDRQKPAPAMDKAEISAAITAATAAALGINRAGVPETAAPSVSAAQPDLRFTPREWANGEEDGIL